MKSLPGLMFGEVLSILKLFCLPEYMSYTSSIFSEHAQYKNLTYQSSQRGKEPAWCDLEVC